ncbi:MAG TPA: hypothetical protein VF950_19075 [Planctomycetota bacterium]
MTAFASPEAAVAGISKLLAARDWAGLAACYDGEPPKVFYDEKANGHPAGFDRWRPFAPGWHYVSHEVEGDEAVVRVGIEIDQGDGMILQGFHEFRMRESPKGWRVIV